MIDYSMVPDFVKIVARVPDSEVGSFKEMIRLEVIDKSHLHFLPQNEGVLVEAFLVRTHAKIVLDWLAKNGGVLNDIPL